MVREYLAPDRLGANIIKTASVSSGHLLTDQKRTISLTMGMLSAIHNMAACGDTGTAPLVLMRSNFVDTLSICKAACIVIPLICFADNATAEAYKCTDNGRAVYSDQPCAQPSNRPSRPATVASERQLTAAEIQAQFDREVAEQRKATEATAEGVITKEHICKAGIAKIMGRDPRIIRITRNEGGVVYLQYVRPDDGSFWTNRCRVDGSRILWANVAGRWRDDPRDEKITFTIAADTVTVKETYTDGSSSQQAYKASQLR